MSKAKTPSFILELALEISPHDEAVNARFEAARQFYNACLDEAKRRLELLRQSKEFQRVRKMPKTMSCALDSSKHQLIKSVDEHKAHKNGKSNKERTEAFKALNNCLCVR